jgi:non-specific serine/threonine protein kinase
MPLPSGTRIGTYEIVGPLGTGGMGEVYRARDTRLGREVALKVLPADVAADADRLERFEREARAVATLNHPNIVTLYSVEDHGGTRVLTMELVDGESLTRQIVPDGIPIARLVELGVALADALAAAHEKGVVHRDLKPANVMLTRDGRVKVLDFGLAKLQSAAGSSVDGSQAPTVASQLTSPGQVVGTVPYMAPEQVRGELADHRTDLFALGTMLYELCAGRRPFAGATLGTISSAILRDTPPSLASLRSDVPSDLERIVARCLEKDPRARFQTALDVANELKRMRPGRDATTIAKPPPIPSTTLLGRAEQLESAARRLREGARVLTISGYGGTGKTRFSIELFHRLATGFAGGAAFISLASVTDPGDVLRTIVTDLGIGEAHGRSALEALATVIGERPVLLVLDNLEQVLDAAPDIAALVSRCPALQIVATSRSPLKIGAESEFALPPLELPALEETSLDALGHCASVALFIQRAEKVKPGFALTPANASAIAAICRRLDGLPLALELAAARVRILEPAGLLQRLDHALDLLTSGDRDLPLRQRTLRATISWSYSLLSGDEQRLLQRLSVFHEGWTFEAMEQVVFDATRRPRALDELDSLVEKGLVRVLGEGDRYALLETIRAFAAEQLHASGESEAIRSAHADYFERFSAGVADGIFGAGQLDAVHRGRAENANTQAAIRWLTSRAREGDLEALEKGLLLCGQLDWFWHMGGQHLTARTLLDGLLPLAAERPPSRGRGLARLAAGMVTTCTGEWERSAREWAGAHADGAAVRDERIAAEGLMGIGYCHLHAGRMEQANVALEESIARSANGVADFIRGISMTFQSMLLFATGKLDAGIARAEEALRIQERLHDDEGGGVALSFLAQMTFAKGDHARAIELYRESLAKLERVDQPEVARVHCEMGWTALAAGDARAARQAFVQGVHTNELVGSPRGTGLALLGLAAVEAAEGRSERAVAIAAAAHALSERAGVVVDHPMDPGVVERIEALKASISRTKLDSLVASASALSPAAILAMVAE